MLGIELLFLHHSATIVIIISTNMYKLPVSDP